MFKIIEEYKWTDGFRFWSIGVALSFHQFVQQKRKLVFCERYCSSPRFNQGQWFDWPLPDNLPYVSCDSTRMISENPQSLCYRQILWHHLHNEFSDLVDHDMPRSRDFWAWAGGMGPCGEACRWAIGFVKQPSIFTKWKRSKVASDLEDSSFAYFPSSRRFRS